MILALATLVNTFLFANQCAAPPPCSCEFLYDLSTVLNCNNTQLHAVPAFQPISIQYYEVEINLDYNQLASIPAFVFRAIASVNASSITINLKHNQISQMDIDAFAGIADKVTRLDMQNNRLTHLPNALSKLISLNELYLLKNPLANLDGHILKTFGQSLTKFSFSAEHFVSFPTELRLLHSPFNLLVSGIPFHNIAPDTFLPGMPPLYKLDINHSELDHIPDAVCNLSNYLTILSFTSSPNLRNTSTSLFDHCQNSLDYVKMLSLYDNQLDIVPNIAAWFPELMSLNLSRNHLHQLTLNNSLPLKLTYLDLSYNWFTKIPRLLNAQPVLYRLYMSGNKITSIKDNDLLSFRNLRTLKLNDNPISHISSNAFTKNTLLSKIELKNSKLFQIPEALLKLRNLDLVEFTGSPINCSCSAMSYLRNWNVNSLFIAGECYDGDGRGSRIYDYVKYHIHNSCP